MLLAVRVALLAAAVAALAGPLFVTAARRQAWDRRIVRAVVVDDVARSFQPRRSPSPKGGHALQRTFEAASLPDGIRRAILWLERRPRGGELVVASPFPIGSMTADVAAIPAGIGVRFERTGTLPGTRTVPAGRLLTSGGGRARGDPRRRSHIRARRRRGRSDGVADRRRVVESRAAGDRRGGRRRLVAARLGRAAGSTRAPRSRGAEAMAQLSTGSPTCHLFSNRGWPTPRHGSRGDRELRAARPRAWPGLSDPRFAAAAVADPGVSR